LHFYPLLRQEPTKSKIIALQALYLQVDFESIPSSSEFTVARLASRKLMLHLLIKRTSSVEQAAVFMIKALAELGKFLGGMKMKRMGL